MSEHADGEGPYSHEFEGVDELEWTAAQAMLQANAETTRALEEYLAQTQYRDDVSEFSSVESRLETIIAQHERLVEDLELALQALDETTEQSEPVRQAP